MKFLRTFLITALLGSVFWTLYFSWRGRYPWWSGIIVGVVFGLVVAILARYRENRVADSPPVLKDEVVLLNGRATHKDMAGWLYVTNRRLLFEGYPRDETAPEITTLFDRFPSDAVDEHLVSIPMLQIANVTPRSLGIDSGLDIVLTDGGKLYFSTEAPVDWVDEISTARQKYLDEPRTEEKKLFP